MRKYVIGGLVTIALLGLFSYNTSNGDNANGGLERVVYNIPLKQKRVISTENIEYVNKLCANFSILISFIFIFPFVF